MKKTLLIALVSATCFAACKTETQAITESQRDAKIDSLVATKMEEVSRLATEDLDRRMSIEVKAKADSIVQANIPASPTAIPVSKSEP